MGNLKISTKILVYFLLVSLIPAFITVYFLVNSAKTQLLNAASTQQQEIAGSLTYKVNRYLSDKIDTLVNISEVNSNNIMPSAYMNQQLAIALNQDPDMQRIAVVNPHGDDTDVFTRTGLDNSLQSELTNGAYLWVTTFNTPYVSSVSYDSNHDPTMFIAVPILASNYSQQLNNLNSANFGKYNGPGSLKGLIIAQYNISNLWNSVLNTKVGKQGYAYVVDSLGHLVAYPNGKFLSSHPSVANVQAVQNFTNKVFSTTSTISETKKNVISTDQTIPGGSDWGLIVEEPVSDIYSAVYSYEILSTLLGLADLAFCIVLSFYFTKQLLLPIRQLSTGAKAFGEGNFDKKIQVNTHDELHELAETFNSMGASIKTLINDLKSNNVNLQLEQSKLNNIINSVSDGVIALNKKGEIVSANPPAAKLIGLEVKDIQGKLMRDLYKLQTEDKPFVVSLDDVGVSQFNDLELPKKDGISYLSLVVSVISHDENDIAAIITINDQTQSRELDFMKLDFVAIAAHELRTPLTVVRGYLDLINKEAIKKLTLSGLENFQKAIEGTDQLKDLINKLLNIARIERGEMEIFIEKLNLTKLVRENVRQHNTTAVLKEQTLSLELDSDKNIYVPGDPASITEVLNNLIGNAIKYTGKGGIVIVHITTGNDLVKVEVMDNGPGVPEELRGRLFTKFYRAERSLIAGTRGTGLGLFISKTIIELQKGTIGIEPDDGRGSKFYFTLPIYEDSKYDKLLTKDKPLGGINGWFKKRHAR